MCALELGKYYTELGFNRPPFNITPDTGFFYPGSNHVAALEHLEYGLANGSGGFTLITGEVGLGKTLLCRQLLKRVPPGIKTAYVFNPAPTYAELLSEIYCDLTGVQLNAKSYSLPLREIYKKLLELAERGERAAVILDEAHRLRPNLLEGLRLLSNMETEREKLIYLILVGQPELEKTLLLPELRPLRQRISVQYKLAPLSRRETANYIRHRLATAGDGSFRFSSMSLYLAHSLSGGSPRRINQICGRAMLAAFAQGKMRVNWLMMLKAAKEVTGSLG